MEGGIESIDQNKKYVVPVELLAKSPVVYANHTVASITNESICLTFCSKLDSRGANGSEATAIPHVSVYMSISHGDKVAGLLREMIEQLVKALDKVEEEQRLHG